MSTLIAKSFNICSSDLGRLAACPGAGCYVLPKEREKPSFGQWYGIFVHRFLEKCQSQGREAALAWVLTKKMKGVIACCARIDAEAIPVGEPEVPFAHDPFDGSARRLVKGSGTHGLALTEQYGRADLIVTYAVERPMVVDWKCGGTDKHPAESTQMLGLAAALQVETGAAEVDAALVGVMSDGTLDWRIATLTSADLKAYSKRACEIHSRVLQDRERIEQGHAPEFVRNAECTWCDLRPACPAWRQ